MFIITLVLSILIGYIIKGKLKNLENIDFHGVWLIIVSFLIEFTIVVLVKKNIIIAGTITFVFNLIMYVLLLIFIYLNRRSIYILIMGIGFLLNAAAIFLNGGTMPVSLSAAKVANLTQNVSTEGLYTAIGENTKLWFLGDIIPVNFIRHFVISIGDVLICIGLMLFIIIGMKRTTAKGN
jgi:hypothetical protein